MNKPNDNANSKPTLDAIESLGTLINECPGEWIVRLFRRHRGGHSDLDQHATEVRDHLRELEQAAVFGHRDSIRTLAAIGNRISDFLSEIAGKPTDKIQENVNESRFVCRASGMFDRAARWLRPSSMASCSSVASSCQAPRNFIRRK